MKTLIFLLLFPGVVNADVFLSFEISHTSSPFITEDGQGLNTFFTDLTYRNKGFYMSGGLGVHSEASDCPEVCFNDNYLARLRIGYEFRAD